MQLRIPLCYGGVEVTLFCIGSKKVDNKPAVSNCVPESHFVIREIKGLITELLCELLHLINYIRIKNINNNIVLFVYDTEVHSLQNGLLTELTKTCNKKVKVLVLQRDVHSAVILVQRYLAVHLLYLHFRKAYYLKIVI